MKEADRLVQEAAAKGRLPEITQENRHLFGLTSKKKRANDDGWRAWWSAHLELGGTGGITHPTTTFHIATTSLAPDGLPWPQHWSLDVLRNLALGKELGNLKFARRFDAESADCGFDLLSPVTGSEKPTRVRCHCCGKERGHAKARSLINSRHDPQRCFAQESRGKSSVIIARQTAISINTKLLSRGIYRQCDPDSYVNNRTPIWFSCDCEEGGHVQIPKGVLGGSRPCQSSRRQPVANNRVSAQGMAAAAQSNPLAMEAIRANGHKRGLVNGTPCDMPWRILAGEIHPSEPKPTCLYLHATDIEDVNVFGITNDPSGHPKHGTWYGEPLIDPIWFPCRSMAVFVEAYFKEKGTGWSIPRPAGWEDREGATELTDGDPDDFANTAQDLAQQLARMSYREFAEEYLPSQVQLAAEAS